MLEGAQILARVEMRAVALGGWLARLVFSHRKFKSDELPTFRHRPAETSPDIPRTGDLSSDTISASDPDTSL